MYRLNYFRRISGDDDNFVSSYYQIHTRWISENTYFIAAKQRFSPSVSPAETLGWLQGLSDGGHVRRCQDPQAQDRLGRRAQGKFIYCHIK